MHKFQNKASTISNARFALLLVSDFGPVKVLIKWC